MKGLQLKKLLVILLSVFVALSTLAIFGLGAAGCVPVINSLSAYQGAPGKVITINGSFFGPTPRDNRVFLGDQKEMHVITASASRLTVMVPYDDPGTYNLEVKTSAGASVPKNFTVTEPSAEALLSESGKEWDWDSEWILFLLIVGYHRAMWYSMESPYASQAGTSIMEAIREFVVVRDNAELRGEIFKAYNESNMFADTGLGLIQFLDGTYDRENFSYTMGLLGSFFRVASSILSQDTSGEIVELSKLVSKAAGDIEMAVEYLPRYGDDMPPKVWISGIPDRLVPGQLYTVTGNALDDTAWDHINLGVDNIEVEVFHVTDGNYCSIAERHIFVGTFDSGGPPPIARGYAHPLEVEFRVPSYATSASKIAFKISALDIRDLGSELVYERQVSTTYKPPRISEACMEDTHIQDLDELSNTELYMEWSDSNADIRELKFEFFGNGVKNRGTFSKTASSLGISGSSGTLTKRMSDLVSVGDVFSSGKCYWAGMRLWLVDASGNISDNSVVTFFLDGEGNERVFKITVGDSLNDGRNDDRFAFVTDTWYEYHLTPKGGCDSQDVYLGDMPPGRNVHLRVWCIYSEVTAAGSCYVELGDGASFTDATTVKEFNINFSSINPPEAEFDIIPPPEEDPPPPGG
ncbi:MAG: hypothetical protein C4536_12855 [Actinobacteria bacterium]|jgi:hypothetical protein|nr:MAG: hypothetical protein C4536_12855 [Actinomycetota bacterium]